MRRLGSVAAQMLMTPPAHMIWQFQRFSANQTTKNTDGSNNTNPKLVVWNNLNNANNAGLCQTYRDLLAPARYQPGCSAMNHPATILLSGWAEGRSILLSYADKKLLLAVNPLVDKSIDIFIPSEAGDASSLDCLQQATTPHPQSPTEASLLSRVRLQYTVAKMCHRPSTKYHQTTTAHIR